MSPHESFYYCFIVSYSVLHPSTKLLKSHFNNKINSLNGRTFWWCTNIIKLKAKFLLLNRTTNYVPSLMLPTGTNTIWFHKRFDKQLQRHLCNLITITDFQSIDDVTNVTPISANRWVAAGFYRAAHNGDWNWGSLLVCCY